MKYILDTNVCIGLLKGKSSIGPYDLLIGASALYTGYVLVTHNTKEFSRIPGLMIEDWEA